MNGREEELLIEKFKDEFHKVTGRWINVTPVRKQYESVANFTDKIDFWKLTRMIFDYTGWTKRSTFTRGNKRERVFRRALIDYIAVNNGCSVSSCARFTNRDHTTVLHSIQSFSNQIETDMYTKQLLREVIQFAKENYHLYKQRVINESDIE